MLLTLAFDKRIFWGRIFGGGKVMRLAMIFLLVLGLAATVAQAQTPEVYAAALGTANLRSGPGTDFALVGEISAGTDYRVLKQHAQVPWILLEVPGLASGGGWVFKDLVQITRGSLGNVPFEESFDELPLTGVLAPAETTPQLEGATATLPPVPVNLVTARLSGRSNIRYAPGVDYPTIATLDGGAVMTVLARHASLPWYKVAIEGSPTGSGWVFAEVIEIEGEVFSLPVVSETVFDFPTPSATPNTVVVQDAPFGVGFGSNDPLLALNLGESLHEFLLSNRIAPRTDREASIFVMDLLSGAHFTLNGGVAYSGMSINKIPVLVSYFIQRSLRLETPDAELLANTMICSENTSTNQVMTIVGEGDILEGGRRVSGYMQQLGLGNTFVVAPFFTGNPDATPAPVSSIQTSADQRRTEPDPFNQMTIEEIGWLLGSVYACAKEGTGPLIETFPDQITQLECQQMIRLMSGNRIGALLEAGVQPGAVVAHKHGWINNTHGDAGIILGPESAYVLVVVNHQYGTWLDFEVSFPIIQEVSRRVWNYFNPNYTLDTAFSREVPAVCNIYGETVISDILSGNVTLPNPAPPPSVPTNATPTNATPTEAAPAESQAPRLPTLTPSPTPGS